MLQGLNDCRIEQVATVRAIVFGGDSRKHLMKAHQHPPDDIKGMGVPKVAPPSLRAKCAARS